MLKINNVFGFVLIIFLIPVTCLFSQNRNYYENLKNKKKQNIYYSKSLLQELKSTNENNLEKLLITREQINKQKEIVAILNKELVLLDVEIKSDEESVISLNMEMQNIKKEYADLILFSYMNLDIQKRMIFILSADNFNKAYKRMIYLKYLSDFRKTRFLKIDENLRTKDSILRSLKQKKESKILLHKERLQFIDSLNNVRELINGYISKTKSEIVKIQKAFELDNQKKEIVKINVTKQISKVEENYEKQESKKISKLADNLSQKFESSKKSIIWPLAKFVVLHHFGDYSHPAMENIIVKNDGIELGTKPESNVHCIFEGKVIDVISIPGDGNSIIIKHGVYYSVYSKLQKVYVAKDNLLQKGQVIGKLAGDKKIVSMNFQLWKGKDRLNPELWLKRQ